MLSLIVYTLSHTFGVQSSSVLTCTPAVDAWGVVDGRGVVTDRGKEGGESMGLTIKEKNTAVSH